MIIVLISSTVIKRTFIVILTSLCLIAYVSIVKPANALNFDKIPNLNSSHSINLAVLNYEEKDSTSLKDPIIDPNFNVMRTKELSKFKAIPLVVGVLVLAIIAPVVTWIYFSK